MTGSGGANRIAGRWNRDGTGRRTNCCTLFRTETSHLLVEVTLQISNALFVTPWHNWDANRMDITDVPKGGCYENATIVVLAAARPDGGCCGWARSGPATKGRRLGQGSVGPKCRGIH